MNQFFKVFFKIFNKLLFTVAIVLILYFVAQTAYNYGFNISNDMDTKHKLAKQVSIKIPKGSSTQDIAKILEDNDLISNALLFRITAKLEHYDGKFHYGDYELNTSMSEDEIVKILMTEGAKRKDIKITIPEGYTVEQIAKYLSNKGLCTVDEFMEAANDVSYDYDFVKKIPERNIRLQGYLFPDTYLIREGAKAKEIISKMLEQFNRKFKPEYVTRAEQLGFTVDQIVTIASIIEREAKVAEERPKMAKVIYNRLDVDMPLQMCSTALYALGKAGQPVKKLSIEETQVDSPYNTYKNKGLPTGPISNPGNASIEAALFPDDNKYLYFVLIDEDKGVHHFSKTLQEHNQYKNQAN